MSERFDREASLAIKAALSCARRQGALEMGGEHLVVGIGLLDCSVAARELLLALDVDPMALRRTVLRALADGG